MLHAMGERVTRRREALSAIREHRRQQDQVLDRQALTPARRMFDAEHASFLQELARMERGRLRQEAQPQMLRRLHRVIVVNTHRTITRLSDELSRNSRTTQEHSLRALAQHVSRLEGSAGALDDDATFRTLASRHRGQLDTARRQAMEGLRHRVDHAMWRRASEMIAQGKYSIGDVIAALGEELDHQWWQVERLVRTETSYAFNAAQAAGVAQLAREFPGMMMRWTELIDDATGQPYDARVAQDSFVLHGQVTPPGGVYTMPSDPRAPERMVGQSWSHPPNRPNDRAVLTPWRRGWGVPAWIYQNGSRMSL